MAKKEIFLTVPPEADVEREENYETQKKVLSLKLRKVLAIIFSFALFYVVLAFVVLTVRFIINTYFVRGQPFYLSHASYLVQFAIESLKLFVYALPLALPIAMALIWRQRGHFAIRLRKFIQYQFTVNGVATIVGFVTLIAVNHIFVTFMQALFINLIYGALAAIALTVSTNPGHTYSLANDTQPILTRRLLGNIKGQFIYQAIVLLMLVFCGAYLFDIDDARWTHYSHGSVHFTLVFNAFVFMSIFNQINARKIEGERNVFQNIHKDYLFIGIFLLEILIQVLTVQIGCNFLSTTPLNCAQWLWCIAFGLFGLLWQQVIVSIPCRQ